MHCELKCCHRSRCPHGCHRPHRVAGAGDSVCLRIELPFFEQRINHAHRQINRPGGKGIARMSPLLGHNQFDVKQQKRKNEEGRRKSKGSCPVSETVCVSETVVQQTHTSAVTALFLSARFRHFRLITSRLSLLFYTLSAPINCTVIIVVDANLANGPHEWWVMTACQLTIFFGN